MKKIYICLVSALTIQLLSVSICKAQIATINLKPAAANITIDGSLSEWGDSLSYYNSEAQVNYALANDKNNLYLVLKTNDPVVQAKILSSGVTFSVDTKGKKKSTYSVTFPMQEGTQGFKVNSTPDEQKLAAGLTKLRKIKADGFKDVEYDQITLQNTYGFKAAINFNEHGFLIYEEAIPLALFHADDLKKGEWMFNVKINGIQKAEKKEADDADQSSMSGGGRGGRGGGGGRSGGGGGGRGGAGGHGRRAGTDNETGSEGADGLSKSVDFWGKFILSN